MTLIQAEDRLVAGATLNRIFTSYDRGRSWVPNPNLFRLRNNEGEFINFEGIAYNPSSKKYIAVAARSTILVGDNGSDGEFRPLDCMDDNVIPSFYHDPDVSRCDLFLEGVIFAEGYWVIWGGTGETSPIGNVFMYSSDDGETWHEISDIPHGQYDTVSASKIP